MHVEDAIGLKLVLSRVRAGRRWHTTINDI